MTKYTVFKQVKVRYTDKGKGRTIVLLHGFMESLEIWNDFSKELSKSFRVVCIDLPGFGETPCIGYVHTMEMMAKCVKSVMDKERLRRYVVIGHSMGGYVTMAFAELFPDNLKGLGLFHSSALADTPEKKESRDKAITVVKNNARQYIKIFFEPLFAPQNAEAHKNDIKILQERASHFPKLAIVNALEGMKDRVKRDWILEMAKYPVLFIIGKHDVAIPYESVLKQTELVKDADVLFLENVGHMGFLEAKEQTIKAVKKFSRRCFTSQ
ncbi:MAG: alpha/beta hydrolase [Bacteroidetes bacterium]|nr:alpha/beta hydrolase [Bacteroidota bacterium]